MIDLEEMKIVLMKRGIDDWLTEIIIIIIIIIIISSLKMKCRMKMSEEI